MGKKGKNIFFRQPSTRGFSCIFRLQSEPQKLWAAEFYEVFFFFPCAKFLCVDMVMTMKIKIYMFLFAIKKNT